MRINVTKNIIQIYMKLLLSEIRNVFVETILKKKLVSFIRIFIFYDR